MHRLNMWFRRYRVDLVAVVVVTIWGVSAPFRKAALAEFDVLPFTALCFLGCSSSAGVCFSGTVA